MICGQNYLCGSKVLRIMPRFRIRFYVHDTVRNLCTTKLYKVKFHENEYNPVVVIYWKNKMAITFLIDTI